MARQPQKRPNTSPTKNFHHILIIPHKSILVCGKCRLSGNAFTASGSPPGLSEVDPSGGIDEIVNGIFESRNHNSLKW
jgi:hypothetical protein